MKKKQIDTIEALRIAGKIAKCVVDVSKLADGATPMEVAALIADLESAVAEIRAALKD
jgi:hypothetical protein